MSLEQHSKFRVRPARSEEDMAVAARLFTVYTDGLGIDLSFQSFAEELAGLPGKYSPPRGELLLARSADNDAVLGCVAVRPFDGGTTEPAPPGTRGGSSKRRCEMKRLYVCPEARGTGTGEALGRAILRKAAELGYDEALLDTLPSMVSAVRLYRKLGFVEIPPYYPSPISGTKFYSKDLRSESRASV